jgi:formylglycine-generating enzyme required for sulfatase activity
MFRAGIAGGGTRGPSVYRVWAQRLVRLLLAGMTVAALAGSVRAAETPERRIALVIGNNRYQYARPLQNAVRDGKAIEEALRERGFEVLSGFDLDRRSTNRLIDDFVGRLSSGTVALVYYSGHGVQVNGANYLIPIDLKPEREADLTDDGIDLGRLIRRMGIANDKFNMAILDACRDNPFQIPGRSLGGRKGLAPTTASGAMILYAAGADQEAIDHLGTDDNDPNGLFTREFLKVMRVPGLPIRQAVERIRLAVSQKAASVGARQMPALYDEAIGDFTFTPPLDTPLPVADVVPPPRPPAVDPSALELALWDSVKNSTDPADLQDYLTQYPNGRFSGVARRRAAVLLQPKPAPTPRPAPVAAEPAKPAVASPPNRADSEPAAQQQAAVIPPPSMAKPPPGNPSKSVSAFRDCANCPEMVEIPPGTFMMGTDPEEARRAGISEDRAKSERPRHAVSVRSAFAVGKYHVTRGEFARFVQETGYRSPVGCAVWTSARGWNVDGGKSWRDPGFAQTDRDPVVCVSWEDAAAYAAWLARTTGKPYRLPAEAEWEYAARAGTTTAYYWGDDAGRGNANCGWCDGQMGKGTTPVGNFAPNRFGLYDMAGNAFQWVGDCFAKTYEGAPGDASVALVSGRNCRSRVTRGGAWFYDAALARAGSRSSNPPDTRQSDTGFRVARPLP